MNGILEASIQHSENAPHVYVIADMFGNNLEQPGVLQQNWSHVYSKHHDVHDEEGRRMPGWQKIRDLRVDLRKCLIANGFKAGRESSEWSMESLTKAEYVAPM